MSPTTSRRVEAHQQALVALEDFSRVHPHLGHKLARYCADPRAHHLWMLVPQTAAGSAFEEAHNRILQIFQRTANLQLAGLLDTESDLVHSRIASPIVAGGFGFADPDFLADAAWVASWVATAAVAPDRRGSRPGGQARIPLEEGEVPLDGPNGEGPCGTPGDNLEPSPRTSRPGHAPPHGAARYGRGTVAARTAQRREETSLEMRKPLWRRPERATASRASSKPSPKRFAAPRNALAVILSAGRGRGDRQSDPRRRRRRRARPHRDAPRRPASGGGCRRGSAPAERGGRDAPDAFAAPAFPADGRWRPRDESSGMGRRRAPGRVREDGARASENGRTSDDAPATPGRATEERRAPREGVRARRSRQRHHRERGCLSWRRNGVAQPLALLRRPDADCRGVGHRGPLLPQRRSA